MLPIWKKKVYIFIIFGMSMLILFWKKLRKLAFSLSRIYLKYQKQKLEIERHMLNIDGNIDGKYKCGPKVKNSNWDIILGEKATSWIEISFCFSQHNICVKLV